VGAGREEVRVVKRLLLAGVVVALLVPVAASAHPLGNFTINRYSELDVAGNRLYVVYTLDLAEIPTFQAGDVDAAAYATRVARNLHLRVNGAPARLTRVRSELAFPPGQGGLRTTRFELLLAGPRLGSRARITYRDDNYAGRLGWKEVVARASHGAELTRSTVPARSISDGLLAYPKSLLQSPLDFTSASIVTRPGTAVAPPPPLLPRSVLGDRVAVRAVADAGFARLILRGHSGGAFLLVSLAIAFFWGAAHALSPGHGKSVITAYLVGARGRARHAVLLGATVTVTHTIGVFALGLVTLSLSQFVLPEQLYPWLNLVSALLIVGVGISVLRWRVREWRHRTHRHHHHDHDHHHDHSLDVRRLLGIGVSGGLIPCPTALVVLLAAISLHRVGYGLVLIVAFSLGLAATITGLGLLAVAARSVFRRVDLSGGAIRLLPAVSALVVLALGVAMTVRAVPQLS
jgi:nickel/cobalt transporter (NicO) family protein